jgi:multimeric flavodoxin WrbA
MRTVIILGSSNSNGETAEISKEIQTISNWDLIDLNNYNFTYYDYEHKNKEDDFLQLMKVLIETYDLFVFATPVYWYSMSGIMKVFFDRITDLLDFEKELGRKLRSKSMAVYSHSIGENLGENFWLPFSETAKYLGMNYFGNTHFVKDSNEKENMFNFIEKINELTNLNYKLIEEKT